ncbi:MAG: hypothetical protein RLZ98_3697 [Pseudomonadota bacterium]|jgi:GT2 family glycosyltransferase
MSTDQHFPSVHEGVQSFALSIIVVSYNTRDITLACLDSLAVELKRLPPASVEVIVVDNDSTDGSAEALAGHPAITTYMPLGQNIGFGRANNLAARHASGEYILLLNPDTIVLERAIVHLLDFARSNPDAGIWGGRTLFADGRLNPGSCWGRMTAWNQLCRATGLTGLFKGSEIFNGEAYGSWPRDYIRHVDIVSGCFFLTTRALWRQLDGFDPLFWMYGEEADFCLRAGRVGYRPMITPAATIIHLGGASERTRTGKMVKLLAAKASLIRRHWRPHLVPVGLVLLEAWPFSRWLFLSIVSRLTGSTGLRQSAGVWREIWDARGEWRLGYEAACGAPAE